MSSMKYDSAACDAVVKALEEVSHILADANSDVQRFINGIPSNSTIDSVIRKKSYKTRYYEDGTSETYLDEGTRSYYINKYKVPIQTASSNLSTIISNVSGLKGDLDDTDGRIQQIQQLVMDYEETKIDPDTTGLMEKKIIVDEIIENERKKVDKTEDLEKIELNVDTDNDGKPDLNIDVDGDGKADLNIDTDSDGKPNTNIDTNGDGKADLNIDVDNDGKPDYNVDTSGDGKADLNVDTNNDGKPDLNVDLDGDGKADLNIDTDSDGKPDINIDIDGDGKADLNIDTNNDGKPDKNIDADGDGVIDKVVPGNNQGDTTKPEDGDGNADVNIPKDDNTTTSDLFKDNEADETDDGFADNIIAGITPDGNNGNGSEDGTGTTTSNNGANGTGSPGATGGIWGTGNSGSNGSGSTEESGGLFPFLPGSSTSSDGENPDFIYRGLYDQSGDGNIDMNQIKYNAIGNDSSTISKGAAIAGAVGLGASGVDAVATLNENRKQEGDTVTSVEDKEEKKLVKTIVSSSILGIVSIGYVIASLMPNSSIFAIILLGVAMAISSVTATSGLKIGKYIGFGAILFVSILTFVLSSIGLVSPIAYVVVFATFVILSIAAFLLDLLKGMFDDKIELLPIIIAIAVGLFFGMLKVLNVINWIVLVILLGLTVGGYFLWDKVIKYKLPDDDDDDEIVDNVIYKPVQYTENSPMNAPEQEKFDPRSLYKDDDANVQPALGDRTKQEDQNPFANYNPKNSSFENAFKDDNNNNNGMF